MFPDVAFDETEGVGSLWRSIFEERLHHTNEPSLWSATSEEQYRFQLSRAVPGHVLRIETEPSEAVVKVLQGSPIGWVVTERRRTLTARELNRFRRFVGRAEFWALPSARPKTNMGFDGAHVLFEARIEERYHFVHRWSPDRDGFARLCDHCVSLLQSVVEPRRSWWFW